MICRFDVVHDLPGLAKLHGGTEKLLSKLDEYFAGGYK
jgi:putative alpha-1,2-mannosidase